MYVTDLEVTDRNRQRVVEQKSLRPIIDLIYEDYPLGSIWIPVLYNICVGYGMPSFSPCVRSTNGVREPAEKQAAEAGCVPALIEVLQRGLYRSNELLDYTCQLLESVVEFCKHSSPTSSV